MISGPKILKIFRLRRAFAPPLWGGEIKKLPPLGLEIWGGKTSFLPPLGSEIWGGKKIAPPGSRNMGGQNLKIFRRLRRAS